MLELLGAPSSHQQKAAPLPYSYESEKAVIGTLLGSPHITMDVAEKLKAEYFFLESHQVVVEVILELTLENIPADMLNVLERARFKGKDNVVVDLKASELSRFCIEPRKYCLLD